MRVAANGNPANYATGIPGCDLCCAKRHGQLPAQRKPIWQPSSIAWQRAGAESKPIAVAHTILVIAYHILKENRPYQGLGGDYFDRIRAQSLKRYYVRRLQGLGLEVTLAPAEFRQK
jgi:hypothetical protein